jgi:hypothetical protein
MRMLRLIAWTITGFVIGAVLSIVTVMLIPGEVGSWAGLGVSIGCIFAGVRKGLEDPTKQHPSPNSA